MTSITADVLGFVITKEKSGFSENMLISVRCKPCFKIYIICMSIVRISYIFIILFVVFENSSLKYLIIFRYLCQASRQQHDFFLNMC